MTNPNLQKHTLHLRRGDFDYIDSVFRGKNIPASVAIRRIVSKFVDTIRADASEEELLKIKGDLNG